MSNVYDVIVVGAGQAGLAVGYYLQQANLRFVILEAGEKAAGSWPRYYDSLKLFSPAQYSALPGLPFPGEPDHYPLRDEVIAYLESYARHFNLPTLLNTRVEQVTIENNVFSVMTANRVYHAHHVIAATGAFNRPNSPQIPGMEQFEGVALHAAHYQKPVPFQHQRVIVVGGGNSAVQIAVEISQVAHVTIATREPIRYRPQKLLGKDAHFWLAKLDKLPLAQWFDIPKVPVIDGGEYRKAIEAGRPDHRLIFNRFSKQGVIWRDGTEERVNTVLFATGYLPNLNFLQPLGALDSTGKPLHRLGVSTVVRGLYYVGVDGQRSFASSTLRGVGPDSRYVTAHLKHLLRVA
jgi:putative flavoprotein involved in K+ transport